MEEMTRRELAFCYIYSQEIQKENSKAQVKLFLDSTEVEDGRTREYVKNVASGIKEHGEEITEKIAKNLKTGWTIERISKVDEVYPVNSTLEVMVQDCDPAFAKLRDLGVELEIRRVPTEGAENIEKLFK